MSAEKSEPLTPEEQLGLEEVLQEAVEEEERKQGRKFTPEETARIKENARSQARKARTSGWTRGAKDAKNLMLSIGLPVPRILLRELVKRAPGLGEKEKKKLGARIERLMGVRETGSIEIKFHDATKNGPNTAYLVLQECPPDHDLGAQLDKLYSRIPEAKQDEIRKHLSVLFHIGRNTYVSAVEDPANVLLVGTLLKHYPKDSEACPTQLRTDPKNTTLFLHPEWTRAGIFVRLESELAPAKKSEAD